MKPITSLLNFPGSPPPASPAPVDPWLTYRQQNPNFQAPPSAAEDDPENWEPLRLGRGRSATETKSELQNAPSRPCGAGPMAKPGQAGASNRAGINTQKMPAGSSNLSDAKPSRNAPAAGASGGRAPLPATFCAPKYIHLDNPELCMLLGNLRDPLCTQLYLLITGYSVFETGEFLGSYAGLMEMCTPPQPERGKRRPGPSMWTLRRSIDDLVRFGLMQRGTTNEEQGQLRLWITKLPIKNTGTPSR